MKIAFIGMMGCGKTSLSKEISKILNLEYISIDEEIEKASKSTITAIFDTYGEEYFRKIESKCLLKFINSNNCIVDCGGGIVINSKNIADLKDHDFTIVFIDRKPNQIIKDINMKNRPLIKKNPNKIYDIYNERIELYKLSADIIIENDKTYNEILLKIIDAIK